MRLQTTGSIPRSVSIICTSVYLSGCLQDFFRFFICINIYFRGPACRNKFSPHWGPEYLSGSSQGCMPVRLSISLSGHPRRFLALIIAPAGHEFQSIISTVVLYPHTGVLRTSVKSNRAYMLVCLSLSLSLWSPALPFGDYKSVSRNCVQCMRPQTTG